MPRASTRVAAAVKPGDRIELRGPGGAVVEGRVRAVSPGVDAATRTGTVYADLPDPKGLPGAAYLEARIDTGRARVATGSRDERALSRRSSLGDRSGARSPSW